MAEGRDHAIVVGGSFAGIVTARVLVDHFDRVTIVERDDLPEAVEVRKGVPQGPHVHGILQLGREILDRLFPGFVDETIAEGAHLFDQMVWGAAYSAYGWGARGSSALRGYGVRRPLLELVARRRVAALPTVALRHGRVEGLATTAGRVAGVELGADDGRGEVLGADLVVDASGRGSAALGWLERAGLEVPDETVVNALGGYASRLLRVPDDAWPGDMRFIAQLPIPGRNTKGGILYPQDGDLHVISLFGQAGDLPPGDETGFDAFLAACETPLMHQVVSRSEVVSPIRTSRATANRWRHYERLGRHPGGFVALGDAAACFNPMFGQGISSACLGAVTLGEVLTEVEGDLGRLGGTFQPRLAGLLQFPWKVAVGFDLRFPETVGERGAPDPQAEEMGRYMDALAQLGTVDVAVTEALLLATNTFDPSRLREPWLVAKVEEWLRDGRTPPNLDPTRPPALAAA